MQAPSVARAAYPAMPLVLGNLYGPRKKLCFHAITSFLI